MGSAYFSSTSPAQRRSNSARASQSLGPILLSLRSSTDVCSTSFRDLPTFSKSAYTRSEICARRRTLAHERCRAQPSQPSGRANGEATPEPSLCVLATAELPLAVGPCRARAVAHGTCGRWTCRGLAATRTQERAALMAGTGPGTQASSKMSPASQEGPGHGDARAAFQCVLFCLLIRQAAAGDGAAVGMSWPRLGAALMAGRARSSVEMAIANEPKSAIRFLFAVCFEPRIVLFDFSRLASVHRRKRGLDDRSLPCFYPCGSSRAIAQYAWAGGGYNPYVGSPLSALCYARVRGQRSC